jgi:hypothetical protein
MSSTTQYDKGSWKVVCDQCGREYKADELSMRWDGLMVCSGDWEPRQPQDFVHGVADKMVPPFTRPEQSDTFIPQCNIYSVNAIANIAGADCAISNYDNGRRLQT